MNVTGIQVPLTVKVAGVSDNGPSVLCRSGVQIFMNFFLYQEFRTHDVDKPFVFFQLFSLLLYTIIIIFVFFRIAIYFTCVIITSLRILRASCCYSFLNLIIRLFL